MFTLLKVVGALDIVLVALLVTGSCNLTWALQVPIRVIAEAKERHLIKTFFIELQNDFGP